MNPKDLPFMAFFIASIDTGFAMADSLRHPSHVSKTGSFNNSHHNILSQLTKEWKQISKTKRRLLKILSFIVIIVIAGLFFSQNLVHKVVDILIQDLYSQDGLWFLETFFTRAAQNIDEIPVENYIHKAWQQYLRIIKNLSLFLVISWLLTTFMIFSETRKYLLGHKIKPFIKAILENIKNPTVILAGVFLGLTCSIRTLGPAAGGLIGLYLLAKYKKTAFPLLVSYFITGAITTYISWPGLWGAPLSNFLESLTIASKFPWDGKVLFGGITYNIGTHPRSYMPVLLSIQFTLTALATTILGFICSIVIMIKCKRIWMKVIILYLWFFVPVALIVIVEPNIYDNFRHFLFVIPPLFTFGAIGLQSIFNFTKRPEVRAIVILLLILPNIISIVRLHPYQYVYYNLLANGVEGAFREYEMDYWGTSYREATEYVNQIAPHNSKVVVLGAPHLVETYARGDLEIEKYKNDMQLIYDSPTFAILSSRYDKDILLFSEAETIYIIERDGAKFAVVKDLNSINYSEP